VGRRLYLVLISIELSLSPERFNLMGELIEEQEANPATSTKNKSMEAT